MDENESKCLAIKELDYTVKHLTDARAYLKACEKIPDKMEEILDNAWNYLNMCKIILELEKKKE